jgi:hypothetical protein
MQYLVSVIDDTAGLATPDEDAAIEGLLRSCSRDDSGFAGVDNASVFRRKCGSGGDRAFGLHEKPARWRAW